LADIVNAMPKTYETDSHGDSAIIHLHYFTSGCDWWIREKDKGVPGDASQHQAFGWVSLNGDEPELGYISIVEIRRAGGELDLYWKPKSWSELRNKPTRDTYTGPEVVYIDAANVFDAVPVKKTIPVTFAVLPPWRRALNL
jgi:hypothetical protein